MANNSSGKATTMADLMKSVSTPFVTLQKGEVLKGTITKLSPKEILVDVKAKTEAVVLEKDARILRNLLASVNVGDEVEVTVLNPESDMGNPVVSLRRFLDDIMWRKLEQIQKSRKPIDVHVTESTKGGLLVAGSNGISGFLPNSHILLVSSQNGSMQSPQELVGKKIQVYVLDLSRRNKKIVFSQKPVIGTEDFGQAVKQLKRDQKLEVTVTNITTFGLFVSVPVAETPEGIQHVDGLIHISELSWEETADIQNEYTVGQKLEVVIIGFDKDAKRVDLSLKRLSADPFTEIVKHLAVDQKITGQVSKVTSSGVVVDLKMPSPAEVTLDKPLEGLIRKDKIPPNVTYEVGNPITAIVTQIDADKHRILLTPVLKEKPIGYR